ncbi:MAG: glutamine-hydrolyzing GMP synthase, partial [Chloroflexota bacterium]|nr:glutamine-hydrolyzing GMP synthase [Chloroflexota bacterium]
IILSGGPNSVYDADAPVPDPAVWSGRIPVLGICYGAQLMARELGGDVLATDKREYGPANVQVTSTDGLFAGLDRDQPVWMSHGDSITRLPEGFVSTAQTESTPFAGLQAPDRNLYGIQFHPEVVHTPHGREVLRNFVVGIAGITPSWTATDFIDTTVAGIRARVDAHAATTGSDGKVICALSGGVDSAVAAALVHRAVGDRLTCIYVDHGLMRKKESELLRVTFERDLGMNLVMVDARERFLVRLAGVEDPEEKRRIIGDEFIRVFEEEAAKIGAIDFLTQGTLYPDVIESATSETKTAQKIKTHHNVGGLPADLRFQLIEPLRYLFKDEVRKVGLELDLPEAMVLRQPFPGPGLAIRIIGEVTSERLDTLREADWIVIDEIKGAGLYRTLWQSFAILTPINSVGVMGDGRTYANVVAIRAVTSEDGMTADWAKLPYDVLGRISSRIVNEVPGVNRVVYDVSSKPPATIEWE